jgi:ATP-dependent helicase HepA
LLIIGGFVRLPGVFGFGKLIEIEGDHAVVSLFYSASRREIRSFLASELDRGFLGPETRVYVATKKRWRVGRIKGYFLQDNGQIDYDLRFPNGTIGEFNEKELDVRCWTTAEDPAALLAAGAAESQFLHDRRRLASERIVATQAAAQGLTSLLSSAIELVPHQVAAVRRVLSDPLQRYLLADEVGMGKTIEAGLIIRQCLIDSPSSRVLVLVPPGLAVQWRQELDSKFRAADYPDAISIRPHDDVACGPVPDLLVIDEAHRVIEDPRIRALAHNSERLLLLSATPVLGDESTFLCLLNLLDPDAYPLDRLEAFSAKVQERQAFGRLLLGLQPDAPAFVLKQRLAEALSRFSEDAEVSRLIAQARGALDDRDVPRLEQACRALQVHIADTYRIHQRVIRARRSDAQGWEFQPRALPMPPGGGQPPANARADGDEDDRSALFSASIEDWREESLRLSEDWEPERRLALARRFWTVLDAAAQGPESLLRSAHCAAAHGIPGAIAFTAAMESISAQVRGPRGRAEVAFDALHQLRRALVRDGHVTPKIVAFCTDAEAALALHAMFEPAEAVLFSTASPGTPELFAEDPRTWLLVADAHGEEGLNLHFAHGILHVDLPLSAARVEQRIGRLDRFGRRVVGVRQRTILPFDDEGSVWTAWQAVLADGFEVFNRSISDMQFILQSLEDHLALAAHARGAAGLLDAIPFLRDRLAEERRRQDEQHALDKLALADDPAEELIDRIEQTEADEALVERDMQAWMIDVMGLKRRPAAWPEQDPFRLQWTEGTLVPAQPWRTVFGADLDRPLTWRRRVAAGRPEVSLLRLGTPMVDACERYMRWDDRGTAFATWRVEPGWGGPDDLWTGFRLCFIVEPAAPEDEAVLAHAVSDGIRRRAQAFLGPWTRTLYVDSSGAPMMNEEFVRTLERPYRKEASRDGRVDINLGSRPTVLQDVVDQASFARMCNEVRARAEVLLRADPQYVGRIDEATRRAQTELSRRAVRLRRRLAFEPEARAQLGTELRVNEVVLSAIQSPRVRLDAFGFIVLAGQGPRVAQ